MEDMEDLGHHEWKGRSDVCHRREWWGDPEVPWEKDVAEVVAEVVDGTAWVYQVT